MFSVSLESQKQVLHFKLKTLDLIEIYFNRQLKSPIILTLLYPLIKLARTWSTGNADAKQLSQKIYAIFRNKISKVKDYPRTGFDLSSVKSILEQIHTEAQKVQDKELLITCSFTSILLTKIILNANVDSNKKLKTNRGEVVSGDDVSFFILFIF